MGQVVVEVPQNINRFFRVEDSAFGDQLVRELEENTSAAETPGILPPRRNSLKKDLAAAFGIWKDRPESAQEIARAIRDLNNGKND